MGAVIASLGDLTGEMDFGELDPAAYPQDQMSAELSLGLRKLPSANDVDAFFGGLV